MFFNLYVHKQEIFLVSTYFLFNYLKSLLYNFCEA